MVLSYISPKLAESKEREETFLTRFFLAIQVYTKLLFVVSA